MKLLVLTPEPIDADALRSVAGEETDDAEVLVITPAVNHSGLRFWMSDADEAIADADERAEAVASEVRGEGAQARREPGESDPVLAARAALATFPADRILIFGDEDLAHDVRQAVDVEVTAAR